MAENNRIEKKSKFSLIELLMIIMLVGIVFTLIVPLRNDKINKEKLNEAIKNIQIIARAEMDWFNDPDLGDGSWAFEHIVVKFDNGVEKGDDLMNVTKNLEKDGDFFLFDYSVNDSTIVATTNKNFGKEGAKVMYYLPSGPWNIGKDSVSEKVLDPNWLP